MPTTTLILLFLIFLQLLLPLPMLPFAYCYNYHNYYFVHQCFSLYEYYYCCQTLLTLQQLLLLILLPAFLLFIFSFLFFDCSHSSNGRLPASTLLYFIFPPLLYPTVHQPSKISHYIHEPSFFSLY